jgi:hypothetical protein
MKAFESPSEGMEADARLKWVGCQPCEDLGQPGFEPWM